MNLDYKNIDNILNKYFEGLTSLEEEQSLRRYFTSENIAAAHKPYKALFQYFENDKTVTNPKVIRLKDKPKTYKMYYAASVALLIGLGLVWLLQSDLKNKLNFQDSSATIQISNPNPQMKKDAEKEIKKFAQNIDQGLKKTGALSIFGSTTKKVFNLNPTKKTKKNKKYKSEKD